MYITYYILFKNIHVSKDIFQVYQSDDLSGEGRNIVGIGMKEKDKLRKALMM